VALLGQSVLAWSLFAYLVAAIPMGVLVGLARGVDIRQLGSGNIGATNAVRVLGKKWGVVVFVLDLLKAYLPVRWAMASTALGELPSPRSAWRSSASPPLSGTSSRSTSAFAAARESPAPSACSPP
jgi:glycerol-3-phosphate acyltransferase PlsY